MKRLGPALMLCLLTATAAHADEVKDRAVKAMQKAGCGACHLIPGVPGASGGAGPPLTGVGRRIYLAGVLPNTTDDMALWISRPQSVLKGNAMPDQKLSAAEAHAIAVYLERLK